jgi:hypothetical protein
MSVKLPILYQENYRPLPMPATHVTKTERLYCGCCEPLAEACEISPTICRVQLSGTVN